MAVDFEGSHPEMDVAEHKRTYKFFIHATIYSCIFLAILLALMAAFLTN